MEKYKNPPEIHNYYELDLNVTRTKVNQQLMQKPFLLNHQMFHNPTNSYYTNTSLNEMDVMFEMEQWRSKNCYARLCFVMVHLYSFSGFICRKSAFVSQQIHDAILFKLDSSLGFYFKIFFFKKIQITVMVLRTNELQVSVFVSSYFNFYFNENLH